MNFTGINKTYGCLGFSCPERSVSTALYVLSYVSAAAVVLLTVCGNLLIIISVCHFKQLHTPTNMLILSLAVSDCLVGVFVIPVALIWMIESCWLFSALYRTCYILIASFLTTTSVFNVVLIAVDRYFALSKPFLYNKTVSLSAMCTVVLSNWFVLFIYNIALQYFNGSFVSHNCPQDYFLLLSQVWSLVDLVLTFVFPLAVIILVYGQVFFIAKKHATAIRELNSHTRTQTSKNMTDSMKSERKAAKVLGILVSVFLACLLPYFVYSVLGNIVEIEVDSFQKVLMLVYLNSAINPVIYALFYPWFRRSVKLILTLQIFYADSALINVL
ncbi:trace amine-associated receptor 13c-like [Electrophorus electricus]|uniref:G-protein coupled receptors family 1 profile domain-containing protein n=1 Tax=Electrophorus electricus TaxID=8005 RepID=A0A4W4FJJ0_ELEEL|nr:trace amine-associated receptor 13c-like [Electrophorus electricus]